MKMSDLFNVFASSSESSYTGWLKSLTSRFGHVTSFFSLSQFSIDVELQM